MPGLSPYDLLQAAAKVLDDKKAVDLKAIRTTEQTILSDYFLIASGTSSTHVKALADDLERELKLQFGAEPRGIEGRASGWVLLDYGTVLVHVFQKEQREYYNLERLWEDGEAVELAV
ncbi:MAG: ribosome silencing factor [Oscillospiraceae bacterium]|nr:ribosome silencing factor [Oscillospiraceae bacterium]